MRLVFRLLLVVMLMTVLSPKFGWDAVSAVVPHAHAEEAAHAMADADPDCHGHHDSYDGVPEGGGHCCPGHVLGHLPGSVSGIAMLHPVVAGAFAGAGADTRFSSRIPEGLERPPRAAA